MPPSDGVLAEVPSSLSNVIELPVRRERDELIEQLLRRNEALEDFAALVAHELKTPLQEALLADDPSAPVEEALDLVDELLEASQEIPRTRAFSNVAQSLDQVARDLGTQVDVTSDVATRLPLPPGPLRVIMRNLLSNAVAAGARHVRVTAVRSLRSWRLLVDDDGAGLTGTDHYAAGAGLGLALCRRTAARFGGVLELDERPSGGTRATLEFAEVI